MQSSPGLSFWGLTSLGSFPDVDTHPDITHCRKDQALAQADLLGSSERVCGPWRLRLFVCLLKAMGSFPRICIHRGSTKLSSNFLDVPSLKLVCGPHYEDPAKQRYQNVFCLEELTCLPFSHSQYYPAAFLCCPGFQETCSKMQCCSSAPASKDWGRTKLTFRLEVRSLGTIIDSVLKLSDGTQNITKFMVSRLSEGNGNHRYGLLEGVRGWRSSLLLEACLQWRKRRHSYRCFGGWNAVLRALDNLSVTGNTHILAPRRRWNTSTVVVSGCSFEPESKRGGRSNVSWQRWVAWAAFMVFGAVVLLPSQVVHRTGCLPPCESERQTWGPSLAEGFWVRGKRSCPLVYWCSRWLHVAMTREFLKGLMAESQF